MGVATDKVSEAAPNAVVVERLNELFGADVSAFQRDVLFMVHSQGSHGQCKTTAHCLEEGRVSARVETHSGNFLIALYAFR